MTAERFVADTNVLISAALRETSTPRAVLRRIEDTRGALLFSDETFEELRTRLQRSRFTRYIDPEDRDVFLAQLLRISEWITITNSKLGCRDEDDDKLLETALLGEADCLVTGDQDLLVMSPFRGIPIISPAELLRSTRQRE